MNSAAAEDTKPAPSEFQQKERRQFKSKAPKRGQKGVTNHDSGMEELDDSVVICPWEDFGDMDLDEMPQFGTV